MKPAFVVDTDVLVDHLRGFEPAKKILRQIGDREIIGYISSVTEAELFAGKEAVSADRRNELNELIKLFEKIILDNEIAQKSGEFRRNYGVEIPDAIIAATAFYKGSKVLTKNKKDFEKIREVVIEEPY
ncbi:MAG: type II toxin-antitoxin system VapC family toxin [Candidatus Aenigmarchaeota archaeon]|nr:type II toxin-antitoxin system VapC family toxin [Candidatus Aenigmarchaeota archaeon]